MKSFEFFKSTSSTTALFQTASPIILPYPFRLLNSPCISPEVYGPAVMFQASMLGDYAFFVGESGT